MFAVITTVRLKPGRIDDVAEIFRRTNQALVADQDDWVGARFTADGVDDQVTVVARWRSADSYRAFAAGEAYRSAMARFQPHFVGPPTVAINEILVEMGKP